MRNKLLWFTAPLCALLLSIPTAASADSNGTRGRIIDITVNDSGSDDFSAFKGEVRIRANKAVKVYRWGGAACPGKDLTAANVALLFTAAEESAKVTPKYKPGAGSNKCLTGFKVQFKKDKGPS